LFSAAVVACRSFFTPINSSLTYNIQTVAGIIYPVHVLGKSKGLV
jgi:hypothetical protein